MRLDVYLAASGLAPSRTRARELIENGCVFVGGVRADKPSLLLSDPPPTVEVVGHVHPYVGRGGVKLERALDIFGVSVAGAVCADIGASTGGFTDCLLRRGASRVFAIDSGSGQLAPSLCADERIENLEHCNARYLTPDMLGCLCDAVVADVSFISQTLILGAAASLLAPDGVYVGLIKPQFECGPGATDRRGIVREVRHRREAIRRVLHAASAVGLPPQGLIPSPILGGDGNREYLMYCRKAAEGSAVTDTVIEEVLAL